MIRFTATLVLVAAVLGLAAEADAAWTPNTTDYTRSISSVRSAMAAFYGQGASASSMPARAQKALVKADRLCAKAQSVLGTRPGTAEVRKSLRALAAAMKSIEKAARKASSVRGFQTFVYDARNGAGPVLYGAAKAMAENAAGYVNRNFTSRKSTRKLLEAGGKLTKAARLAGKTAPNYHRAIEQARDAIGVLRRLLDA